MNNNLREIEYKHRTFQIEQGLEYECFVIDTCKRFGLTFDTYESKQQQYNIGESPAGIEIKLDKRMKDTGNIYIETHEKRYSTQKYWNDGGILRRDNTIIWMIGDYKMFFIFSKQRLLEAMNEFSFSEDVPEAPSTPTYTRIKTPTSKGFLIPTNVASFLAMKTILITNGNLIETTYG